MNTIHSVEFMVSFSVQDDSLVLEADSSQSGGPVVKWFLKRLI